LELAGFGAAGAPSRQPTSLANASKKSSSYAAPTTAAQAGRCGARRVLPGCASAPPSLRPGWWLP